MILMNFLKNSPVFELEQCSLHINGVELHQDCTGDQIPPLIWLVVGIPSKNRYTDTTGHTAFHLCSIPIIILSSFNISS